MKPTVNPSPFEMPPEEIKTFLVSAVQCVALCRAALDRMADLHPHGNQYPTEAELRVACEDHRDAQRTLEGLVEFFETSLVRMSTQIDEARGASFYLDKHRN